MLFRLEKLNKEKQREEAIERERAIRLNEERRQEEAKEKER